LLDLEASLDPALELLRLLAELLLLLEGVGDLLRPFPLDLRLPFFSFLPRRLLFFFRRRRQRELEDSE